ncbi:ATP-binding protein [Streptomyces tunisiensis]|uniref:ATP-binding protein n=1 Tax=Streptomyces tunisiensis TaxID=948699 RepID=UPI00403D6D94
MGRGKLRIHLGAAPGVGKTHAMLAEAHRRVERDTDCVVAFAETHGRPRTDALLTCLEQVPHRRPEHGGVTVAETDLDAVLARRPRVALADELAHTNAPGSRNAERRQDVEERVRETSGIESATLLERAGDVEPWTCAGRAGPGRPVERPEDADVQVPVGDHTAPALTGRVPAAEDRRVLAAFAAQAAVVLDRRRLREQADRALAEGNRIRTALLAAVSHDPRTPPAGIKAAVSSLRSEDVERSDEDRAELLEGIEDGADRLDHLVGNLLDLSRLHTGTVTPLMRGTDLDEVVPRALGGVPEHTVVLDVPETLPMVDADPGPLERAMANVIENAVKYSPPGERVPAAAGALADRVEVRVVDRGPGLSDEAEERIFAPFQRHGDAPRGSGVGPGLAVARGFTEAMGGTLNADGTPGGGLTMTLTLHAADARPEDGPDDSGRGLVTAQDERRTS